MDTLTLRVAFAVIAVCVLVLFYGATYRSTRSAYSGWWCVSLAVYVTGCCMFLLNGTPLQVVANPLGNTLAVAGSTSVWAAVRSLRGLTTAPSRLLVLPAVVLLASELGDPSRDIWSGGAFFLGAMAVALGMSAQELRLLLAEDSAPAESRRQHRFALSALLVMAVVVSVFYAGRCVAFVAVGPYHPVFTNVFGSQVTTLLTMAMLVVVTFSMSALSHEQQTSDLRQQASHDGLTGLLNRTAFLQHAERVLDDRDAAARGGVVMVADLDGFKALNDGFGHAAGDRALSTFATACRSVLGDHGIAGRLGGDEFAVVLPDGSRAERVAAAISRQFHERMDDNPSTTVSFGIGPIAAGVGVKDTIIRADIALYQAKAAGRNRVVRYDAAEVDEPRLGTGSR